VGQNAAFARSLILTRRFAPGWLFEKIDNLQPLLHSPRMAKPALGRGLGALMGGNSPGAKTPAPAPAQPAPARESVPVAPTAAGEQVHRVPITQIKPCPFQPRKHFEEEPLKELADSIREQGILQPLVVRASEGGYELIAGERRWRAAQIAGLNELPVLVRQADDKKVLELALIENLQRRDLNIMEEALGFSKLIQDFALTQEEAAIRVGKNRATVANTLRLLQLPPDVQNFLRSNLLSFGHARAILGANGTDSQKQIAEQVIREGLSVRETEALVVERNLNKTARNGALASSKLPSTPDVHVGAMQTRLQERFGTKVLLKYRKGKGAVEIRFFNDEDLERIMEIIGINLE
jgi:ParB family chromosome partitioning protein